MPRPQFRLRSLFLLTAIVAAGCLVGPPIVRELRARFRPAGEFLDLDLLEQMVKANGPAFPFQPDYRRSRSFARLKKTLPDAFETGIQESSLPKEDGLGETDPLPGQQRTW
jgi:hypothetical protein